MKEIQLTQGQVAKVDDEDFEYVNQWKWMAGWAKQTNSFYAKRRQYNKGVYKTIYMARVIMNTPDGMFCDHINHDTLDNRKKNLRNITRAQNLQNQKGAHRNSVTGILGVLQKGKGFRAQIHINGKIKHFPTRKTIEEAKQDRKKAEEQYYIKSS